MFKGSGRSGYYRVIAFEKDSDAYSQTRKKLMLNAFRDEEQFSSMCCCVFDLKTLYIRAPGRPRDV